jgi:hypothetical protein
LGNILSKNGNYLNKLVNELESLIKEKISQFEPSSELKKEDFLK